MKAVDPELMRERSRVLEGHLGRIEAALPADALAFKRGTDTADGVSLHLLFGTQVVVDLAVFCCIHCRFQARASYGDAVALLAHDGRISDPLAERLEKAANFRDAFVHAFDDIDAGSIYRAAKALPDDLRMFMAEISGHVGE